jgi:hypothetical protein
MGQKWLNVWRHLVQFHGILSETVHFVTVGELWVHLPNNLQLVVRELAMDHLVPTARQCVNFVATRVKDETADFAGRVAKEAATFKRDAAGHFGGMVGDDHVPVVLHVAVARDQVLHAGGDFGPCVVFVVVFGKHEMEGADGDEFLPEWLRGSCVAVNDRVETYHGFTLQGKHQQYEISLDTQNTFKTMLCLPQNFDLTLLS